MFPRSSGAVCWTHRLCETRLRAVLWWVEVRVCLFQGMGCLPEFMGVLWQTVWGRGREEACVSQGCIQTVGLCGAHGKNLGESMWETR